MSDALLWVIIALTIAISAILMLAGYLVGARLGVVARQALREHSANLQTVNDELHQAVQAAQRTIQANLHDLTSTQQQLATIRNEFQARTVELAQVQRERDDLHSERDRLAVRVAEASGRVSQAQIDLAHSQPVVTAELRSELQRLLAPLLAKPKEDQQLLRLERELDQLFTSIEHGAKLNTALLDEVRRAIAAVDTRGLDPDTLVANVQEAIAAQLAQRNDATTELRDMLNEVMAPLLERERAHQALAAIAIADHGLSALPNIMNAITDRSGLTAAVLSDDCGLPLAASQGTLDADALAALASYFQTLAERTERVGAARPIAVVVFDEDSCTTLHRMFTVDDVRFTLSVVARGQHVTPNAADAAIAPLERVLTRSTAVAS